VQVLVTGGCGYIGSHIVQELLGAGHAAVVVDLRAPRAGLFEPGVGVVVGDVRDAQVLDRAFAVGRVDGVIHLAGLKSVAQSVHDPAVYFDSNVVGTLRLLEAMQRARVRAFVYSSSAAVYGTPEHLPIGEDAPLRPENPYGESKLLAERMLPWFESAHGIRYLALRYFNAAGAALDGSNGEDWSRAVNLVPLVIEAGLGRRPPVEVFGSDFPTPDGTAVRDYIHVVDLARAHLAALETLISGGRSATLNLGTGMGVSVLEVVRQVADHIGTEVPHAMVGRRQGDPAAVWADPSRAREVLGWSSELGIGEIVASAVAWHRTGSVLQQDTERDLG
jgi:UDP-glucose-4-epimerase GalE